MTSSATQPSPPRFSEETIEHEYRMLIGGEWVLSATGETFRCVDPFEDRKWGRVPLASADDVDRAVRAARRAFDDDGWPQTPPVVRAKLLRRLATLIEERADELALTQVHENGKLLTEMGQGARALVAHADFCAGLAEQLHGYSITPSVANATTYTVREPLGVIAAVTPWNTPLGLLSWKLFPALAAGCTIVIKPSEVTPTSTLLLAELCQSAGYPPGVVNVVTGFGDPTGAALVSHPGVDKIAFTGSTATGRAIAHAAAERVARVSLELGGKSPSIVFEDADLENAVHGIMAGIFAATGQSCMAGSRVLVQASVYDEVVAMLTEKAQRLRLGDPLEPSTQVGPVAFRPQLEKVLSYIEIARSDGAVITSGGGRPEAPADLVRGLFVEPTVVTEVSNQSRVAREEIFGPVASVIRFGDEDDAVRIANDTPFGLASGIWTENVGRAHRLVRRIRAGTVWVNTYRMATYTTPFGGFKQSGLGREMGLDSLHPYTEEKTVWIDHGTRQQFGRVADRDSSRTADREAAS